ncbi:MAG: class III signal peptide-containing protein [Methanobrevibacter sp.]|uniref:class III signal peptide-containing protein n=1 Tax=Methanobrevibacter sp. TaxID=66852 RepID=UPI0026DF2902|nr:class III signal peptide-containing protein [Methanobrevibacter sp.]MDO5849240.1 class III signal peptide-containing protein [Methanobrevibacter sp.]
MDNKGQLSMEFIFLVGVLIVILVSSSIFILNENELMVAMAAARNGVNEGIAVGDVAVFPDDVYGDYEISKDDLLIPNSVNLIKIKYNYMGFDSRYNKEKIQFNVTVSSDTITDKKEQDSVGDRINYNLRKSVALSFSTENLTNGLFNPVFSKHYIYTTSKVKWVKN